MSEERAESAETERRLQSTRVSHLNNPIEHDGNRRRSVRGKETKERSRRLDRRQVWYLSLLAASTGILGQEVEIIVIHLCKTRSLLVRIHIRKHVSCARLFLRAVKILRWKSFPKVLTISPDGCKAVDEISKRVVNPVASCTRAYDHADTLWFFIIPGLTHDWREVPHGVEHQLAGQEDVLLLLLLLIVERSVSSCSSRHVPRPSPPLAAHQHPVLVHIRLLERLLFHQHSTMTEKTILDAGNECKRIDTQVENSVDGVEHIVFFAVAETNTLRAVLRNDNSSKFLRLQNLKVNQNLKFFPRDVPFLLSSNKFSLLHHRHPDSLHRKSSCDENPQRPPAHNHVELPLVRDTSVRPPSMLHHCRLLRLLRELV
mmetsp:Transcript_18100/g.59443  ORF Transcript_18100/g.59443 Transcript_18100/m.59443 type:complete len:372 (+) Transcript_18100:1112-2227(+)